MNATLQALLAQNPGLILQALQSQPVSAESGDAGPIEGYALYDPAKTAYGQSFQRYDPQGALVGEGQFKKPGNALQMTGQFAKDMAPLALAALGANAVGGMLGGTNAFGGLLGGGQAAAAGAGEAAGAGFGIGGGTSTLTPAAIEAGLGTAGYGTNAAAAASGMFNPATVGAGAGLTFGPGAAGAAGAGTSLTKMATDAAGSLGGKAIGGLLGAAAGAANSGDKTQTTQQRLDPRMEAMLYGADGKSGYLGAATDWFNQNKGGNPLMLQGAQMMADFYRSPQYTEGYNNLRSAGLGLLNTPMAGNPFMRG